MERCQKILRRTVSACVDAGIAKGEVVHVDATLIRSDVSEGDMIEAQVDEVLAVTWREIGTVTADSGYAFAKVYGGLERRGIDPLIPAKREPAKSRVPLRREARHHELPSGQGTASGQASKTRAVLPRQGEELRALPALEQLPFQAEQVQDDDHRRRLSGAAARPSAVASKERRRPATLPVPFLVIGGFPRENEDSARVSPRGAVRPRQHEYPVLPDGRRDQPEAARDRFRCAIPRLRPDSNARNARFRGSSAISRPDSPHARQIRLTPPRRTSERTAALTSPEIAEGRVIQQPPTGTSNSCCKSYQYAVSHGPKETLDKPVNAAPQLLRSSRLS